MKSLLMLNGEMLLKEKKTGVDYFHLIVTKTLISSNKDYKIQIGAFDETGEVEKLLEKDENMWLKPYIIFTHKKKLLRTFMPIESFFGEFDIYFCDGFVPYLSHRAKRICIVHDLIAKTYPENYSFVTRKYLDLYFKRLKKADLVFAVSEATKTDLVKYYKLNSDKVKVCYGGSGFEPSTKHTILDNNMIDLNKRYLFYIGDMRVNKNLIKTVSAFLDFCEDKHITDYYFYLAGNKNGDYETVSSLVSKSKHGNQVKFLGYISDNDKDLLYQNCDGVLFTSVYEGFGMPIVEGMKYYKPVITSNCSSMKEVGEGAALLVDPHHVETIKAGISKAYYKLIKVNRDAYNQKLDRFDLKYVALVINEEIHNLIAE